MPVNRYRRHHTGRRVKGAVLLAFLLFAGAVLSPLLAGSARADETDGLCALTVLPGADEDINDANVVVDLYKIADMEIDPFSYTTSPVYDGENAEKLSVGDRLEDLAELNNAQYRLIANSAARIALNEDNAIKPDVQGLAVNTKMTGLHGLYLLIARGSDLTGRDYISYGTEDDESAIITKAYSGAYAYTFLPELIALPSTSETIEPDQTYMTSDGEWQYDITATLKPSREPLNGHLRIIKNLLSYENRQPVTFVYDVKASAPDGSVYSNVVSITYQPGDGAGTKYVDLIGRIPVGSEVTVTEVYTGANYTAEADTDTTTITAAADREKWSDGEAAVSFDNNYEDTDKGGGSITNKFTYETDGENQQWSRTPTATDDEGNTYTPNVPE